MKPLPNFPGYLITAKGKVYSKATKRYLSLHLDHGYLRTAIYKRNRKYRFYVHRLVAMAYNIGGRGRQINHIDGNRLNNHYTNLEWCTAKQNTRHAMRLGLGRWGKND